MPQEATHMYKRKQLKYINSKFDIEPLRQLSGKSFHNRGVAKFGKLARNGNAEAIYLRAMLWQYGNFQGGFDQRRCAIREYLKLAKKGWIEPIQQLIRLYIDPTTILYDNWYFKNDSEKAIFWWKKLHEQGAADKKTTQLLLNFLHYEKSKPDYFLKHEPRYKDLRHNLTKKEKRRIDKTIELIKKEYHLNDETPTEKSFFQLTKKVCKNLDKKNEIRLRYVRDLIKNETWTHQQKNTFNVIHDELKLTTNANLAKLQIISTCPKLQIICTQFWWYLDEKNQFLTKRQDFQNYDTEFPIYSNWETNITIVSNDGNKLYYDEPVDPIHPSSLPIEFTQIDFTELKNHLLSDEQKKEMRENGFITEKDED